MSKLPSASARDVVKVAQAIGFEFDRQKGSHAVYYHPVAKKHIVIPIHKERNIKLGTLRGIIDDMGLTVEQFISLL